MFHYKKSIYFPHCFLIFLLQTAKFTAMVPELLRTHLCRTNLKQLTILYQGPNFGTLFLFQSLFSQIFLALRQKSKSFYLYKHWIGQAAHSQHLSFLKYIVVSEVASPITRWLLMSRCLPQIITLRIIFFRIVKRHKNKNKNGMMKFLI